MEGRDFSLEPELGVDDPDLIEAQWRALLPSFDHESTSLFVRMRRTTRILVDSLGEELEKRDLTVTDFDTLAALYRQGPPRTLTISSLGHATARTHGSISVHVERLRRRGLVSRLSAREDGRVSRVRLSPKGVTLVEKVIPEFIAIQREMFSALSGEERRTLNGLLKKVWHHESSKRETA